MNNERKVTIIEPTTSRTLSPDSKKTIKLRVAAYARVSTEQDEQQSSYEAQVNFYTNYIQSNPDWNFVGIFADEGITGTNKKKREGFNKMIEEALSGKIDLILTKSISRFARNTVDALETVRELKAVGVEVIFEKENLHTFDPKCEVMLTIMSSLAQEESRSISENIRWSQQKNMQEGKVFMPYSTFLGYKKGKDGRPEIVEEEAKIVRQIYDMFLEGMTIRHIAKELTERGIPTPGGKTKWCTSTVRSILSNEKYKGDALLQKTYTVDYLTKEVRKNNGEVKQYLVEHSHMPIIEPEVFDLVQEKLQKQLAYHRQVRDYSPLCNKLICGDCGDFYGRKSRYTTVRKGAVSAWFCNSKYRGDVKCSTPAIHEDRLNEALAILDSMLDPKNEEKVTDIWNTLIENATIYHDYRIVFHLKDGKDIETHIKK